MEDVGQAYGYILYRTQTLVAGVATELALDTPHDYAVVYAQRQARRARWTGGWARPS